MSLLCLFFFIEATLPLYVCLPACLSVVFVCLSVQRCVREAVFLSDVIPSWLGPAGYCFFAVLGTACIPLVYPPGENRSRGWEGARRKGC